MVTQQLYYALLPGIIVTTRILWLGFQHRQFWYRGKAFAMSDHVHAMFQLLLWFLFVQSALCCPEHGECSSPKSSSYGDGVSLADWKGKNFARSYSSQCAKSDQCFLGYYEIKESSAGSYDCALGGLQCGPGGFSLNKSRPGQDSPQSSCTVDSHCGNGEVGHHYSLWLAKQVLEVLDSLIIFSSLRTEITL